MYMTLYYVHAVFNLLFGPFPRACSIYFSDLFRGTSDVPTPVYMYIHYIIMAVCIYTAVHVVGIAAADLGV